MNADDILADLRAEEGWRALPYPDHLGYLTIGYGFLIDERRGGGLPRPVGEFWLRYEVNERTAALTKRWPPFADQPADVQRALVLMAFQMGVAGVLGFRCMLAALAAGDRETAADEALDSEWRRDPKTAARAGRVAALIRGGLPK